MRLPVPLSSPACLTRPIQHHRVLLLPRVSTANLYKSTLGWLHILDTGCLPPFQGGNFNGLSNQPYYPGGQQQQPQQQQQDFFAQGSSSYGNVMGGGQQQQQAGNSTVMFGQTQHSGLQQLESAGPSTGQGMHLAPGDSMQDAFGGKAAGGMLGQQQQLQQSQQQG
jgi:hypothetical protein